MKNTRLFAVIVLWCCLFQGTIAGYAQSYEWARSVGGSSPDYSEGVAVDESGNVYITGYFKTIADFDPGPGVANLISSGDNDVFIAKYDAGGNYVWAKKVGGIGNDEGLGIALDGLGNVYITGFYSGLADFDPGTATAGLLTSAGGFDAFVAKYDTGGNYIWAKSVGNTGSDQSYGIATDGAGNVYATGLYSGTVDFDPGPGTSDQSSAGDRDVFVAKYDTDGNYVWAKSMGGSGADQGFKLAVDGPGNVYVTGAFAGTADFDPGVGVSNLVCVGLNDIFLAKYDTNGNYIWADAMGGGSIDVAYGVAVDGSGNVYITGYFNAAADFDPGASTAMLSSTGSFEAFLAKYDANGNYVWAGSIGGTGIDQGLAVAVDGSGYVFVTGTFAGTADFDMSTATANLTSSGNNDVYVAKYNTDGNYMWAKSVGGSGSDLGYGVVVDAARNIYVTGYYSGSGDFNPGPDIVTFTSAGGNDGFILKLFCSDTTSSHITIIECSQSYTFHDSTYTTNGVYVQKFFNSSGCDSTVTLDLTLNHIDEPVINVNGFVLGVVGTYATYQWIKNGQPISGATNATYTVTENAAYQVAVTSAEGCTDTSVVYTVTNVTGIDDINSIGKLISIFPNPANDVIYINSPVPVSASITGIDGRSLVATISNATSVPVKKLSNGIYFLRLLDKEGRLIKVEKIVKQ